MNIIIFLILIYELNSVYCFYLPLNKRFSYTFVLFRKKKKEIYHDLTKLNQYFLEASNNTFKKKEEPINIDKNKNKNIKD